MENNDYIYDIKEQEFEEKVLVASSSALIIVDFWAPWCGPCKQLTPILEKITKEGKGKINLIKINIDESKQIAAQFRIQSIPAVFAFKNGQPVDAFQGVLPEKKIIEFIEKSLGEKLIEDFKDFYNQISNLFNDKEFAKTKEILENFLSEHPNEIKSFALYIECLTQMEQFLEAESFYESLDKELLENPLVKSAFQKLIIKKKNSEGPSIEELLNKLNKKQDDIKVILELSDKYFAEDLINEAFDLLLINFKKHKTQTKNKLLEYFEALGNENPKTLEYRKKLSSLFFS
mgnify:CR=1 FL=1|jgi:putative thioredoxin